MPSTSIRVHKIGGRARYEAAWYNRVPPDARPRNVFYSPSRDEMWYDIVRGCYPWHPLMVRAHYASLMRVWKGAIVAQFGSETTNLHGYASYVAEVASRAPGRVLEGVSRRAPWIYAQLVSRGDEMTPVRLVHGDATLSNSLWCEASKQVVLIDPGDPRGLCVRELDEAKIMQSLLGFDVARDGQRGLGLSYANFEVKPVHWVLLASHLVRLIPHMEEQCRQDVVDWAVALLGRCSQEVERSER